MPRIRIIKLFKDYRIGDVVEVSPNIAHGLIDCGVAILSKDMTNYDYEAKSQQTRAMKAKRQKRG